MPAFFPRRFTSLETLKTFTPENLVAMLLPYREYLAGRGLILPDHSGGEFDHQALVDILIDPDPDMPRRLVDAIFYIHEMSTPDAMTELLEDLPPGLLDPSDGKETPADVALQVWLKAPELLENKHAERYLVRPKSFITYPGRNATPEGIQKFTETVRLGLQQDLDVWYEANRRGKGCRVFAYPRDGEVWCLIRHGEPIRREGTFDNGESSSVYYRPEKFEVVVINRESGDLALQRATEGELALYRKAFGKHLFGDEEHFTGDGGSYTLEPLINDGEDALGCADVPGMDWVRLKEVEIFRGDTVTVIYKATDLFVKLGDRAADVFASGFLVRATFVVKFADCKTPRTVTIRPPSRTGYTRDGDRLLVEEWMLKRGFLVRVGVNPDDETEAALAGA